MNLAAGGLIGLALLLLSWPGDGSRARHILTAALAAAGLLLMFMAAPAKSAPRWLVDRIIHVESGGNARATGRAGEIGLMQIKCRTARSVGFKGHCSALYRPAVNVRYGSAYLDLAIARARGDLRTAVSLYQRGVYARFKGCSAYCRKVFGSRK